MNEVCGSANGTGESERERLFHFPWEGGSDRREEQRYGYGQRFLMVLGLRPDHQTH